MKIKWGYTEVRKRISEARAVLQDSGEQEWSSDKRARWSTLLDEIEQFLDAPDKIHRFSIIRSLDAFAKTEGPIAEAMLQVSRELMRSGIDQFR